MSRTLFIVAGARPNFMKIAPLMRAMGKSRAFRPLLVHTGQHYDEDMSGAFFKDLDIPAPDVHLNIRPGGSHTQQTADIMLALEPVVSEHAPFGVLVVGDVNSTLACALVCSKTGIPLFHVEAGLRSYDRAMPEEINRVLTDQVSELLFTTERTAHDNLLKEGIAAEKIHFVGNVMVDSLEHGLSRAIPPAETLKKHGVTSVSDHYALLTLHRPSNVDHAHVFRGILEALDRISATLPIIFPAHPRTRKAIEAYGLGDYFTTGRMNLCPPASYLEMLGLMKGARLVLTDSGGLQEETTALGIPCFTIRDNTERPITIEDGTNTLVGTSPAAILTHFERFQSGVVRKDGLRPELWDGRAAERIVSLLEQYAEDRDARAVAGARAIG